MQSNWDKQTHQVRKHVKHLSLQALKGTPACKHARYVSMRACSRHKHASTQARKHTKDENTQSTRVGRARKYAKHVRKKSMRTRKYVEHAI